MPKKSNIQIKIEKCNFNSQGALCSVIKDGGDDPDVTHGAEICVKVSLTDRLGQVEIDGGEGVGRVTKPGLGLDIGSAAIKPTPKKMIMENILEVAKNILQRNESRRMIVVPKGKELAQKTDNT